MKGSPFKLQSKRCKALVLETIPAVVSLILLLKIPYSSVN